MDQSKISDGLQRLRRLLGQTTELAEQVERGQSQRPFGERFATLAAGLEKDPVRVAILVLDENSERMCSGWFSLSGGISAGAATEWPAPGPCGVVACYAPSLDTLVDSTAAAGPLLATANLLIVMGFATFELAPLAKQSLAELTPGAQAVWAVAWSDSDAEPKEARWTAAIKGENRRVTLMRIPSLEEETRDIGTLFSEIGRGSRLGDALFAAGQARATEAAIEMLEDRLAQDVRKQTARRKGILVRAGSANRAEAERALRDATESLRRQIEDGLTEAELSLAENLRQRTLPTSTRKNALGNLLEDLVPQDIAEEPAGRMIRLTASNQFVGRVLALLRGQLQEDLATDGELLSSRQDSLTGIVNVALAAAGSTAPALRLTRLDRNVAWDALREMIHLDPRYQGEMPVRKWIDRLSYGRRPVFAIMMVSSMVGAAFGLRSTLMAWLAPGLLLVFVGGVIWTFRSFREERQDRIDRELLRMREALGTEARRLYELVLREWQNRASRHLRDLQRDLAREADDRLRACQVEAAKRSEQERKEAQDKLKVLDGRLREYNALLLQVQRLRPGAEELHQSLVRIMQEAWANSSQ